MNKLALIVAVLVASLGASHDAAAQTTLASFNVDAGVTREDAELVTESVRLAQVFFTRELGATIDREVHVNIRLDARLEEPGVLAFALGRSIVINAGSPSWQQTSPAEKVLTVVHEYVHFYQYLTAGAHQSRSPVWFEEGLAEYLSLVALDRLGIIDQPDVEAWSAGQLNLSAADPSLADLESMDDFGAASRQGYLLAYFAVAELVQAAGLDAIDVYYRLLESGATFHNALEPAFGLDPADHESRVEARLATLGGTATLLDDFSIVHGVVQESPVRFTGLPKLASPDDQVVILARTAAASVCTLSLTPAGGTSPLKRTTFADGEGDIFWLVTIPMGTPIGDATLSADCGAAPVAAALAIGP
jgi:hypothetical protein